MVERLIEDLAPSARTSTTDLGSDLRVLEAALNNLPLSEAQAERRELIGQTAQLHAAALIVSAELETMGYDPSIEVPGIVAAPLILGQDAVVGMAIARRAANRELARHPDDPSKLLITGRKSTLY